MEYIRIILSNLLWLTTSLASYFSFKKACGNVRKHQIKILKKNILQLERLRGLRRCDRNIYETFRGLPLTEYEDYLEEILKIRNGNLKCLTTAPVTRLLPTSGTSGGSKLIPYNKLILKEYQNGVKAWLAGMFLAFPKLMTGKQYWSISPNTGYDDGVESLVPIGFETDREYLGSMQGFLAEGIMAVPDKIAKIADMESFEYLTLFFLIRERKLKFISIWHPSFLTILIDKIDIYFEDIIRDVKRGAIGRKIVGSSDITDFFLELSKPDLKRSEELARIDLTSPEFLSIIWPELEVISCWTGGESMHQIKRLKTFFKNVVLYPKGITATEGIVSIPMGREGITVLAVNTHFFEFIDEITGIVHPAWELEEGRIYSILLTTGSGFCRYKLHDRIKVTGFFKEAPCVDFMGRDNRTSDMTGEKVHPSHIESLIKELDDEFGGIFEFAWVLPEKFRDTEKTAVGRYRFYFYGSDLCELQKVRKKIEMRAEEIFCENFHYLHARNLGQLWHIKLDVLKINPTESLYCYFIATGIRSGDVKLPLLLPESTLEIFEKLRIDE